MVAADGLVFVLDTADRKRFAEANSELQVSQTMGNVAYYFIFIPYSYLSIVCSMMQLCTPKLPSVLFDPLQQNLQHNSLGRDELASRNYNMMYPCVYFRA